MSSLRLLSAFLLILSSVVYADERLLANLQIVAEERQLLQYKDDDKVKGPSADILRLLINNEDKVNNIQFMPWSRAYQNALNHPNTMIMSMVRTAEREDKFHWITKVSELARGFVSLKSAPHNHVTSVEEALNKLVVVVRGSYSHSSLIKLGFTENKNLYLVPSVLEAITLLVKGKVDLIYTDPSNVIHYFVKQNITSDDMVDFTILPQTRRSSYIALNKASDPMLVEWLIKQNNVLVALPLYHHLLTFKPPI